MIKAVIFDCDGVLVDSEILALEIELAALAEIGLDYSLKDFKGRFLGMSDAAFEQALSEDRQAKLGQRLPEDFGQQLRLARVEAVKERLKPVPLAGPAVTRLNLPKAVASSTGTNFLALKLTKTGLAPAFGPHAYSADLVARAKPAPDIFLYAAKALGVAAEDCLIIEDSKNGVLAGKAAGARVLGFLGGGHMDPEDGPGLLAAGADGILESWGDPWERVLAQLGL